MANTPQTSTETAKMQSLIGRYIEMRSSEGGQAKGGHLDEDTLNAFLEGRIDERQAMPVVNHLSACSFCRHISTELVRLDLEFADMDEPVRTQESSEPAKVSSILSGILSRIFGSNEAAVFAHEEREEDEKDEEKQEKE